MRHVLQQAGVIPYRIVDSTLEILLITSRSSGDWIVPKGMVDFVFTREEAALQEALEEAGVRGDLGPFLGNIEAAKGGVPVCIALFALPVSEIFECWLEQSVRRRRWFSAQEAASKVRNVGVSRLILALLRQSRL